MTLTRPPAGSARTDSAPKLYLQRHRPGSTFFDRGVVCNEKAQALPVNYIEVIVGHDRSPREGADLDVAIAEKVVGDSRGAMVFFGLGRRGDTT